MTPLVTFALLLAAAEGDAYVADAGTLVIAGNAVELHGIDLPRADSVAGADAKRAVEAMIDGRRVTCRVDGVFLGGKGAGVCRAGGMNIAEHLVVTGHALDCTRTSGGQYRALEGQKARRSLARSTKCAGGFVRD